MPDGRSTAALVQAASAGDGAAWGEIVERYASLVIGTCHRYRLSEADVHDVSQTVWLRLVERLPSLREAEALPGWLAVTTRHECLRVARVARRQVLLEEPEDASPLEVDFDADLLAAERRSALRRALASLTTEMQELLTLLLTDPPLSYAEISRRLDMPVGSIGPTRARCLERLRRAPALAALMQQDDADGLQQPGPVQSSTKRGA